MFLKLKETYIDSNDVSNFDYFKIFLYNSLMIVLIFVGVLLLTLNAVITTSAIDEVGFINNLKYTLLFVIVSFCLVLYFLYYFYHATKKVLISLNINPSLSVIYSVIMCILFLTTYFIALVLFISILIYRINFNKEL